MNTITHLVKEKGITNIIIDYKQQMEKVEHKNKFRYCLKEINDINYHNTNRVSRIYKPNGSVVSCFLFINIYNDKNKFIIVNSGYDVFFKEINDKFIYTNDITDFVKFKG